MTNLFRFRSWVYKNICLVLVYDDWNFAVFENKQLRTFDMLIAICYSNTNNMWRFYFVDRRRLKISPQPDDACHSRSEVDCENFKPPAVCTLFDYYTIIRNSVIFQDYGPDNIILLPILVSTDLYFIIAYFCVWYISYIIATSY